MKFFQALLICLFFCCYCKAQLQFQLEATFLPNQDIRKISVSPDGNVYMIKGSDSTGVAVLDTDNQIYDFTSVAQTYSQSSFTALLALDNGITLIGTKNDYVLKYQNGQIIKMDEHYGVANRHITSITYSFGRRYYWEEAERDIWIGTKNMVYVFKKDLAKAEYYRASSLYEDHTAVIRDSNTQFLTMDIDYPYDRCGNTDKTLLLYNREKFYQTSYGIIPENIITATAIKESTYGGIIIYMGDEKGLRAKWWECNYPNPEYLITEKVTKVIEFSLFDGNGHSKLGPYLSLEQVYILTGTANGLYFSNDRAKEYVNDFQLASITNEMYINDIAVDPCKKYVWLATTKGLIKLKVVIDKASLSFKDALNKTGTITFCKNDSVELTVNVGPEFSVQWLKGDKTIAGENQPIYKTNIPGEYKAVIANACFGFNDTTFTAKLVLDEEVIVKLNYSGKVETCPEQPVILQTTLDNKYTYQWYKNGVELYNTTNQFLAKESGEYQVKVTNCNGFTKTSEIIALQVNIIPVPKISYSNAKNCVGDTIHLQVPDLGYNIRWFKDGAQLITVSNQSSIKIGEAGVYNVYYEDNNGCKQKSGDMNLAFYAKPAIQIRTIPNNNICPGERITLTAITNATNILWSTGEKTSTIIVKKSGNYSVWATNNEGCTNSASTLVNENRLPDIDILPDTSICEGNLQPVIYKINRMPNHQYFWNEKLVTNNIVYGEKAGIYTLKAVNPEGCIAQSTVRIDSKCVDMHFPNVFTPNGDEKNEYFIIEELIPNCELLIYNRFGKIVYQNSNYGNNWDGSGLNNGIYFYSLKSQYYGKQWKGWVHLIR